MNRSRILLADDDVSIVKALGPLLESEGFEVIRAADGQSAVEMFRQHRPDLVLLDLNMPVKGGWSTLLRLKNISPLLPIIVITARPDACAAALAGGAAALMQKPQDIPRLLEAMRESLDQPAGQRLSRLTDSNRKPSTSHEHDNRSAQ